MDTKIGVFATRMANGARSTFFFTATPHGVLPAGKHRRKCSHFQSLHFLRWSGLHSGLYKQRPTTLVHPILLDIYRYPSTLCHHRQSAGLHRRRRSFLHCSVLAISSAINPGKFFFLAIYFDQSRAPTITHKKIIS